MSFSPVSLGTGLAVATLPARLIRDGFRDEGADRAPVLPEALRTLEARFDVSVMDLPSGLTRIRVQVDGESDWTGTVSGTGIEFLPADGTAVDAELSADAETWDQCAADPHSAMPAFRDGRLRVRRNVHLAVGFLAAASGERGPERALFTRVETSAGELSVLSAGQGEPLICLHGLGATKSSFLDTVSALSGERRVIAVDLPGFGDSDKPVRAAYDAPYFAAIVIELMDELGIERADFAGNSMGGRVALELGLSHPERVGRLVLLAPALAWLRGRHGRFLLKGPLTKLGFIQPAPRLIVDPLVRALVPNHDENWIAAGIDEFLRAFLTPRGRVAFYESARNIYLDEPHGEDGLWRRLEGLRPPAMFVWGNQDQLVPIGFRRHVELALDSARHVELECGHVPHVELPERTHAEISAFLRTA